MNDKSNDGDNDGPIVWTRNKSSNEDTNDSATVWTRQEIESPCVRVCVIHEGAGLCVGCRRSRHEIAGWSRLTRDERREIMASLPARASLFNKRRGGRANRVPSTNS